MSNNQKYSYTGSNTLTEKIRKYIAYTIFCAFWIPIGLFVWISMLIRITLVFVFASTATGISGRGVAPNFERKFDIASKFFARGFKSSYCALFSNDSGTHEPISWGDFLGQLFLTIIFFVTLYLFYELKTYGIHEVWYKIVYTVSHFNDKL